VIRGGKEVQDGQGRPEPPCSRPLFDGSRASLGTCPAANYGSIERLARTIPMPR